MSTNYLNIESQYVSMIDGTRLAVSLWSSSSLKHITPCPVIVSITRYWRAINVEGGTDEQQIYFYEMAKVYNRAGYIFVTADARGSGASFGTRSCEIFPEEIKDTGELIDWIAKQPWCDGRVVATGTSYTANTAIFSLVTHHDALKGVVCRAPDFDLYRFLFAPGGICNNCFAEAWGKITEAQDQNNVKALQQLGAWQGLSFAEKIIGVRPVDEDEDGDLLHQALADHQYNFNAQSLIKDGMDYIDSGPISLNGERGGYYFYNPFMYKQSIENSQCPLFIRCGWHDAGTQLGALAMYNSFDLPVTIIIGPWDHMGFSLADPFSEEGNSAVEIERSAAIQDTVDLVDKVLTLDKESDSQKKSVSREIKYFTLGENRWKRTTVWPLDDTQQRRFYLSLENKLSPHSPSDMGEIDNQPFDAYHVNIETSTGKNNRWYAQMGHPIYFPDRQDEDKKLLVYDSLPLAEDIEITGHPVMNLYIGCNQDDFQVFVYLEMIDPNGHVRLLTEGQLRSIHRKVSTEHPPYPMFGPYHSLKQNDACWRSAGEISNIAFDLFPISVRIPAGYRIRVAIAGADKDVFTPMSSANKTVFNIFRSREIASYIDLPIIRCSER